MGETDREREAAKSRDAALRVAWEAFAAAMCAAREALDPYETTVRAAQEGLAADVRAAYEAYDKAVRASEGE